MASEKSGADDTHSDDDASIVSLVEFTIADMQEKSCFFPQHPPRATPRFEVGEVALGALLGTGEFGAVFEVQSFQVDQTTTPAAAQPDQVPFADETKADESSSSKAGVSTEVHHSLHLREHYVTQHEGGRWSDEDDKDDEEAVVQETRLRMAKYPYKNGTARYAVKRLRRPADGGHAPLRPEWRDDAMLDLACEAEFLSRLRHPNLVRLRGTVGTPGTTGFMLILDKLVETLESKIDNAWNKEEARLRRSSRRSLFQKQETKVETALSACNLFAERLLAVYDVARAVRHLHRAKLLFRDLKPQNIGVDARGEYRLFDLGLVKELKPHDLVDGCNDGYNATGCTGSRRYMAPEVVCCRPYGFSADVYSFAMVFWQVFSLKRPFGKCDATKLFNQVVKQRQRPAPLHRVLTRDLHELLEECWSHDPAQRPSFDAICQRLQLELTGSVNFSERDEEEDRGALILDRSQYLLNLSKHSRLNLPV